jgi:hypothetical protein
MLLIMLGSLGTHVLMKKGEPWLFGESELDSQLTQLLQLLNVLTGSAGRGMWAQLVQKT